MVAALILIPHATECLSNESNAHQSNRPASRAHKEKSALICLQNRSRSILPVSLFLHIMVCSSPKLPVKIFCTAASVDRTLPAQSLPEALLDRNALHFHNRCAVLEFIVGRRHRIYQLVIDFVDINYWLRWLLSSFSVSNAVNCRSR